MHNTNYIELMNHLENLRPFAIITTGRTGSDFLQSLMDSHTEILTFNGPLYFHDFWHDSKCNKQKSIDIFDLLDEFIGIYIHKFKSKYDYQEQKDQLGEDGKQSINKSDISAAVKCLKSNFLTGGLKVGEFEKEISKNKFEFSTRLEVDYINQIYPRVNAYTF